MKKIIFNDNNLTIDDIDDKVIKARVIILNNQGELFLMKYINNYFLPGGALFEDEDVITGLLREVKEELGINLNINNIKSFYLVEQFINGYPKRGMDNDLNNRYNKTYYYITQTDEEIDYNNICLDENEKKGNLTVLRISPENVLKLLQEDKNEKNIRNYYFTRELNFIIQELIKQLSKERR